MRGRMRVCVFVYFFKGKGKMSVRLTVCAVLRQNFKQFGSSDESLLKALRDVDLLTA